MNTEYALQQRLEFMKLDESARKRIQSLQPTIQARIASALDKFYEQVRAFPETNRFFSDEKNLQSAHSRQQKHWNTITSAEYGHDYVQGVRTIGNVHARIGLEPRWYIGGYSLLTEQLIDAVVSEQLSKASRFTRSKKTASELSASLGALVKAVMLDMDLSISIYIEALEEARKAEEEARTTAEREQAVVVNALAKALKSLSLGDLTANFEADVATRYEQLKRDFNGAMTSLEEAMQAVATNSKSIRTGSDEIAQASNDLSRRTEQQAASLEQTAAALEEITATVMKTASSANHAREAVTSTKMEADRSSEISREAIIAMSAIEASSQQVEKIISVIDEIAFQTNLLALNAGVEAARAGDAGRGFAVVASEVRALAQRSAQAAKEIKSLISASADQVATGVLLVSQTEEALQRIADRVVEVHASMVEIAAATNEQSIGLNEVNLAVNHMDQVTQQNAAMVEEVTAATHSLQNDVGELSHQVERFKIHTDRRSVPLLVESIEQHPVRSSLHTLVHNGPRLVSLQTPKVDMDHNSWKEF